MASMKGLIWLVGFLFIKRWCKSNLAANAFLSSAASRMDGTCGKGKTQCKFLPLSGAAQNNTVQGHALAEEKEVLQLSGPPQKGRRDNPTKMEKKKGLKAKKPRKKRKSSNEQLYSANYASIETLQHSDGHDNPPSFSGLKFSINGKPAPLSRHRTGGGFIYNPSFHKQQEFRQMTREILCSSAVGLVRFNQANEMGMVKRPNKDEISLLDPVFPEGSKVSIKIIFRMPRPNSHFVGNKRSPERLRETASKWFIESKRAADVDNLAKFVLDSFNGIIYSDDHQVASLSVIKIPDSEGNCTGATDILVQQLLSDGHVESATHQLLNFDYE
jgi:hypothetical protein